MDEGSIHIFPEKTWPKAQLSALSLNSHGSSKIGRFGKQPFFLGVLKKSVQQPCLPRILGRSKVQEAEKDMTKGNPISTSLQHVNM